MTLMTEGTCDAGVAKRQHSPRLRPLAVRRAELGRTLLFTDWEIADSSIPARKWVVSRLDRLARYEKRTGIKSSVHDLQVILKIERRELAFLRGARHVR